jgi:uncharacterized damage-inducible protein DinB
MNRRDFIGLFDYNQWANEQLLAAAEALTEAAFRGASDISYRGVRATLVHTLDVEQSWRRRIRGESPARWDVDLPEDDFPTVEALRDAWRASAAETRAWLERLDDSSFELDVDLGPKDRYPLATYLLHILTHSAQQRRDVALLLERAGHPPPEIEFLYYADAVSGRASATSVQPDP